MPKVCILSSVHPALDNRIFYREAQSLQRAGYNVTLIAIHDKDEVRNNINIIALPRLSRWKRPWLWLILFRHALAAKADLYHFHDPELLLVVPLLRLLTGSHTIYDIHESHADFISIKRYLPRVIRYPVAWLFKYLEPLLARFQSGLIFADSQIADAFHDIQCPKATLFNFPALSFVNVAISEAHKDASLEPAILHLGSHERSRGTHLMIEAFHQVLQEMSEARLLLVGPFYPSGYEQEIRENISQRKIESAVTITGRVSFEKVSQYLAQATLGWIALQPVAKYQKNIPTKLFEYMAYGLPVVSSDLVPIQPFFQDGEFGYLVQADDPAAHAQAILKILRQPQRALDMGGKGQELVRTTYNWGEMEKRLQELYKQVLGTI